MNQTKINYACAAWAALGVPLAYAGFTFAHYSYFLQLFHNQPIWIPVMVTLLVSGAAAIVILAKSANWVRWIFALAYCPVMAVLLVYIGLVVACQFGDCSS